MKNVIVSMVLLVAFLGNVGLADYYFDNSTGDGLWRTDGNWDLSGVPGSSDHTRLQDGLTATIDEYTDAYCNYLVLGQNSLGGSVSMTGGSLTLASNADMWVGYNGDGTFTMTDGSVTVGRDTRVSSRAGAHGILQIEGGSFTTPELSVPQSGTGKVNLFGGTLEVTNTSVVSLVVYEGTGSFEMRGDAVLKYHGDRYAQLFDLIVTKERIYAGEAGKSLEITEYFDTDGETVLYNTVTVVPEPATIAMLSIGSVFMLRRKK